MDKIPTLEDLSVDTGLTSNKCSFRCQSEMSWLNERCPLLVACLAKFGSTYKADIKWSNKTAEEMLFYQVLERTLASKE